MSEIDLGEGCYVEVTQSGNVMMTERYRDQVIVDVVSFPPEQMDALCTWWQSRREMRERSDKSGEPVYTIKPPVWSVDRFSCPGFSGLVQAFSSKWMGSVACGVLAEYTLHDTEAAARAWCEQRYYEWVRQFLEECK